MRELDAALGRFPQYEVGAEMRIAARRGDRETFERLESQLMLVAPGSGLVLLLANAQGLHAALHVSLGEHELAEPLLRDCVAAATPGMLVTTVSPPRRSRWSPISHEPAGRRKRTASLPS